MKLARFPFGEKEEKKRETWEPYPGSRIILEVAFTRHNIRRLLAVQTLEIEGESCEVIRYDSCHGVLHRHLLFDCADAREELGWPLTKETVHKIKDDLKKHWRERREKYLKKMKKGDWP